jgi:hypothetical protein
MKKYKKGLLTLTIQKDSPGKAKESNWLPAPDGPWWSSPPVRSVFSEVNRYAN